jgi:hypothetical protein
VSGESGVGKSALLVGGLLERLREDGKFLAVYMGEWGSDWARDPLERVTSSLLERLTPQAQEAFADKPQDLGALFDFVGRELKKCLVLVLDQFDDYAERHAEQLGKLEASLARADASEPPSTGSARPRTLPEALAKENPFWRAIAHGVNAGVVHCVIATRSDQYDALEKVRFVEPRALRLVRPASSRAFLDDVLKEVEAAFEPEALTSANSTWPALRDALARDLEAASAAEGSARAILPVQLATAVRALEMLKPLTAEQLFRMGGVSGLEALYIRNQTEASCADLKTALRPATLRSVLATLVTGQRPPKTIARPVSELVEAAASGGSRAPVENALRIALEDLREKSIVRSSAPNWSPTQLWSLYHDYLCRGVREAVRRDNPVAYELGVAAAAHKGRRGFEWWSSLLSPRLQIRLAAAWARGGMRYGEHASFARWSLLTFLPWVALAFAVVAFGVFTSLRNQARDDLGVLSLTSTFPDEHEVDMLWDVAQASGRRRRVYLSALAQDSTLRARTVDHLEEVLHGAAGLTLSDRRSAYATVVKPCLGRKSLKSPGDALWCLRAAVAIGVLEPALVEFVLAVTQSALQQFPKPDGEVARTFLETLRRERVAAFLGSAGCEDRLRHIAQGIATSAKSEAVDDLVFLAGVAGAQRCELAPAEFDEAREQLIRLMASKDSRGMVASVLVDLAHRATGALSRSWLEALVEETAKRSSPHLTREVDAYLVGQFAKMEPPALQEVLDWRIHALATATVVSPLPQPYDPTGLLPVNVLLRGAAFLDPGSKEWFAKRLIDMALSPSPSSARQERTRPNNRAVLLKALAYVDGTVEDTNALGLVAAVLRDPVTCQVTVQFNRRGERSKSSDCEEVRWLLSHLAGDLFEKSFEKVLDEIGTPPADSEQADRKAFLVGQLREFAVDPVPADRVATALRSWATTKREFLDSIAPAVSWFPCDHPQSPQVRWLCSIKSPQGDTWSSGEGAVLRLEAPARRPNDARTLRSIAAVQESFEASTGKRSASSIGRLFDGAEGRLSPTDAERLVKRLIEDLCWHGAEYTFGPAASNVEGTRVVQVTDLRPITGSTILALVSRSQLPSSRGAIDQLVERLAYIDLHSDRTGQGSDRQARNNLIAELLAITGEVPAASSHAAPLMLRRFLTMLRQTEPAQNAPSGANNQCTQGGVRPCDSNEFAQLGIGARALARAVPFDQAPKIAEDVVDELKRTQDPFLFEVLLDVLLDLKQGLDWPAAMNFLAWPTCVTRCRDLVTTLLSSVHENVDKGMPWVDLLARAERAPGVRMGDYPRHEPAEPPPPVPLAPQELAATQVLADAGALE